MNNPITVLNQLLNYLPLYQFYKLVDKYRTDRYTKKFKSFHQFIVLLVSQILEKDSLRDIETAINLSKKNLNYISLPNISKSTLSDSLNTKDYKIFEELFYVLLGKLTNLIPKHPFKFKNELYALDSTTIDLCLNIFPWAKFRKRKGAIKIHTKLNQKGNIPEFMLITDGKKTDIKAAKEHFKFTPDSIIVMDKGYIDFKWLYSLDQQKAFFVTRAKTNMDFEVIGQQSFTEGTGVVADETIILKGEKTSKTYPKQLRMVTYYDYKTEKIYTFITNNFKLAAKTIADIYKSRWQVGVPSQAGINKLVKVQSRPKDSNLVAREAVWNESEILGPSDKIIFKDDEQNIRPQRIVNVDVASLHAKPVVETVYNARRQKGPNEMSMTRWFSPAGYQRWHDVNVYTGTGETLDTRRRKPFEWIYPITLIGKWVNRYQGGGSGCSTKDRCATKRIRREGPGPISNLLLTVRQG